MVFIENFMLFDLQLAVVNNESLPEDSKKEEEEAFAPFPVFFLENRIPSVQTLVTEASLFLFQPSSSK